MSEHRMAINNFISTNASQELAIGIDVRDKPYVGTT
jgi:hypothetical protein